MLESNSFYIYKDAYKKDYYETNDGHKIYYACYGNPLGKPLVILHGGPGYGSSTDMARFFNPQDWNVLVFDQRGAGLSKPLGSTSNNTTKHLIRDINCLTKEVGFKTFSIKGTSWGTTLALAYAQSFPERVSSMILVGVFLGEKEGSLLTKSDGVERHFPDAWSFFINALPKNQQSDPFSAYYHYIFDGSEEEKNKFAREVVALELGTEAMGVTRSEALAECETFDFYSVARIEFHYLKNNYFLYPDQILKECKKIKHIPTTIVHGRYDMVCPPMSAWKLSKQLNNCDLIFADLSGHSESESQMAKSILNTAIRHLELLNE